MIELHRVYLVNKGLRVPSALDNGLHSVWYALISVTIFNCGFILLGRAIFYTSSDYEPSSTPSTICI